ncbi:unnamed protein product [Pleuronectes platessa]|uniref:Uncharacterized protein n=1 Tax=Pleuronectes platessa TaxID=8262 RepID=A0A9N7TTD3_PLEPL|nr:unnamed protein product [Pleuronectes platessa]
MNLIILPSKFRDDDQIVSSCSCGVTDDEDGLLQDSRRPHVLSPHLVRQGLGHGEQDEGDVGRAISVANMTPPVLPRTRRTTYAPMADSSPGWLQRSPTPKRTERHDERIRVQRERRPSH